MLNQLLSNKNYREMKYLKSLALLVFVLVGFQGWGQISSLYCNATGPQSQDCTKGGSNNCCTNFFITRVQLGTLDNQVNDCGPSSNNYTDYSSTVVVLQPGQNYSLVVEKSGSGNISPMVTAFLDFNQDRSFSDDERFTLSVNTIGTGNTYNGNIVIPPTVTAGSALLRIRGHDTAFDDQPLSGCETTPYGETEDYRFDFVAPQCGVVTDAGPDVSICDGNSVQIGGSPAATGGNTPYQYSWTPTAGLSDPSIANPIASPTSTTTYTLTVTDDNGNGCSSSDDVVVTVNNFPAVPSISYSGNDTVCSPNQVTLSSSSADGYQWFLDGNLISGADQKDYDATVSGDYTVEITNSDGCKNLSDPETLFFYDDLSPSISASGNTTVCSPATVDLNYTSSQPGTEFEWYKDGALIPAANSATYTASSSGDYHALEYYLNNGKRYCDEASNTITVQVVGSLPKPTVEFLGASGVCTNSNDSIDLKASVDGVDYEWFRDGTTLGLTSQIIRVRATGDYHVEITSGNCSQVSDTVTVSSSTPVQPTVSTNSTNPKCPSDAVVLESTLDSNYQWMYNGQVISGADEKTFSAVDPGSYQVITFNSVGCADTSNPFQVNNFQGSQKPTIAPDGPTVFCSGDSVRLFATSGNSYQWYKNGNQISGANKVSYLVLESGFYQLETLDGNGCQTISDSLEVTVTPPPAKPAITASGSTDVCHPDSVIISAPSNYQTYQWYRDGVAIQGATQKDFTVKLSGGYEVLVTDANGCSNTSDIRFFTVRLDREPKISYLGSTTICDGQKLRLRSNYTSGNQWYLDGAAIPNANGDSYEATQSGKYHFVVTDASCSRNSDTVEVSVNDLPNKPDISPKLDSVICAGESITFRTTAPGNKSWYKNGELIFNTNQDTLVVTSSGDYFVEVSDSNNCSEFSDTVKVTVLFESPLAITPGDTVICDNATIPLTANNVSGNQWFFNGNPIQGATGQVYNANAAGSYHVEATVGRCSDVSDPITISHISGPGQTPTATLIGPSLICAGDETKLVAGNTGSFNFLWHRDGEALDGEDQDTLVTNKGGAYAVVIYSANGCTDTSASVSVINYDQPTIDSVAVTNSTCTGAGDGGFTVYASGGGGQYFYSLTDGNYNFSPIFENIDEGIYMVYLRDNNGCKDSMEVVVGSEGSDIFVYMNLDNNITCNNENDAQITATGTGGQGQLEYTIDGGITWTTDEVFSGLTEGTYEVTVRDTNGCTWTAAPPITVTNPDRLQAVSFIFKEITCTDANDAVIRATPQGGSGFIEYKVNNGPWLPAGNVVDVSNLSEGVYTLKFRDQRGCQIEETPLYIHNPSELEVTNFFVAQEISCFNASDGILEVQAQGGGGGYEYSINPPNYQASNRFTDLAPGFYTVRVRDSRGCVETGPSVVLSQPNQITVSAQAVSHNDCFGERTGQIKVTGGGGVGTLAFSTDGTIFSLADTIDGLRAGTYTIYAMDEEGCVVEANAQVTINEPDPIQIQVIKQDVDCFDAFNGEIEILASGGAGGFSYSVGGSAFQPSNVFSGLQGGTYQVTVEDQTGCTQSQTVIIEEPKELVLNVSKSDVRCFGENDGQIIALAQGGTPPYSYSYNAGASFVPNPVKTSVGPGIYSVVVRDANGCTASSEITITQPDTRLEMEAFGTDVTCNGSVDGIIRVSASGGTGNITFSLDNGTYQTDSVIANLNPGFYIVNAKDSNGCIKSQNITILQPAPLTGSIQIDNNVLCNGAQNANITVLPQGGNSPYQYALHPAGPYQTSPQFTNLAPGIYRAYLMDSKGCFDSTSTVEITNPQALSISATVTQTIGCNGSNTGTITASASGGFGSLTYSINNGPGQASPTFSGLAPGNYVVKVTDQNSCEANSSLLSLTQPPALTLTGGVASNANCFGIANGQIVLSASGGTQPYSYSINGQDFQASPSFNTVAANTYNPIVIDANGCQVGMSNSLTVTQPNEIILTASIQDEINGNDGAIDLTVTGGQPPYSYLWTGGLTNQDLQNIEGNKSYTVQVKDIYDCTVTGTYFVDTHVGIESAAEDGNLKVYPNPTNGQFQLEITGNTGFSTTQYRILNTLGEVIKQGEINMQGKQTLKTFDLSAQAKGVYHLQLTDDQGTVNVKILVQ